MLLAILVLLLAPSALALNDPGHDSLYVLLLGDSSVIGSINITQNVNATFLKISNKLFGDYLDVVANGTVLGTPTTPRIMGASSSLYIDSTGNLYINTKGGTSNLIQIGDVSTNGVTLNVSGTIRQQGVAVCLANGSNCIGGTNTGNVSTVTAGDGLTDSGTATDPILNVGAGDGISVAANAVAVDSTVCRSTGTNCPSGATGSSGWVNGSTQVILANNATNVSVGYASSAPIMFVDTGNARIGVRTATPRVTLDVAGSTNITGSVNSGGNAPAALTVLGGTGGNGGQGTGGTISLIGGTGGTTSGGYPGAGGSITIRGGAEAFDDSEGPATGGSIYIDGGPAAGSYGTAGNIILGNTYGRVGIGTSSLGSNSEELSVRGGVYIATTDGGSAGMYYDGTNNKFKFGASSAPTQMIDIAGNLSTTLGAFFATSSGNVGIGTTTPSQKLHVEGNVNVSSGNITVQQSNGVCFNPGCTSRIYYNGSATIIEGQ